jgi:hypothetical protein
MFILCKEKQDNGEIYEIRNYFSSLNRFQDDDSRLERRADDSGEQVSICKSSITLIRLPITIIAVEEQ